MRVRRGVRSAALLVALTLMCVVWPTTPAFAWQRQWDIADAHWRHNQTESSFSYTSVYAIRDNLAPGRPTWVQLTRGSCWTDRRGLRCRIDNRRVVRIDPDDMIYTPLVGIASVTFKTGKMTHSVRWAPDPAGDPTGVHAWVDLLRLDDKAVVAAPGFVRASKASGRLFNREMPTTAGYLITKVMIGQSLRPEHIPLHAVSGPVSTPPSEKRRVTLTFGG